MKATQTDIPNPIQVSIYLPAERALRLCSTTWGEGTLAPNEDQLRQLSAAERESLGAYIAGAPVRARLYVATPDWTGVVTALREKIREDSQAKENREQVLAKSRGALEAFLRAGRFYDPQTLEKLERPFYGLCNDPRTVELNNEIKEASENQRRRLVLEHDAKLTRDDREGRARVLSAARTGVTHSYDPPPPRALEFEDLDREETEAAANAEKEMDQHAVRTLLELAAPALVERFDAGVLPQEELTPIVADHLFERFDAPTKFARYHFLSEGDIEHGDDCYEPIHKFKSDPYKGTFDADEWDLLKQVKAAAPEDAEVGVRQHKAWCGGCDGAPTERYSIRVTRKFAGKTYHRSFAL